MNRVLEIEELVSDLLDVDEVALLQFPQWNEVADDVIRKLRHVRSHCLESSRVDLLTPPNSSEEGSVHSDAFGSSFSSSSGNLLTPGSSPQSAYAAAAQAFDRQIFSRCVQIVEAAQRSAPIEMAMVSLAHHSYMAMVEDAEDVEDSSKFALWWCQFLERAEPGRPANERGELFDYRLSALERLFQLDPGSRKSTGTDLLKLSTRSYRMASVHIRSFHSKCLRRLEKLIYWIDETRPYCEGYGEFSEAVAVASEAVKTSLRDQRRFQTETDATRTKDIDFSMCCELLEGLARRLSVEDDIIAETPTQKSIDNLMGRIFPDETDSGYDSLPRPEEDVVVMRL